MQSKNPNWKQNLNFVLSGGDYSAFLEKGTQVIEQPQNNK